MKLMKRYSPLLLIFCFILFLSSCRRDSSEDSGAAAPAISETPQIQEDTVVDADEEETIDTVSEFDSFTNRIFVDNVASNTLNLHYTLSDPGSYGIKGYKITLGRISLDAINAAVEKIKNYQTELHRFTYSQLNKNQQLTYDILEYYFANELSSTNLILYAEALSPALGTQAQLPVLFAEYAFNREKDITDYLSLLSDTDEYFGSIIEFEKEKSKSGLFMADYAADDIIEQCREFINDVDSNFLITIFSDKLDSLTFLSQEKKEAYRNQNAEIIKNHVIPAYQLLIDGLTLLKGSGTNEEGLCRYPEGLEYYKYLVKYNTGSTRSVDEIQTLISSKIASDMQDFLALLSQNPSVSASFNSYEFKLIRPEEMLEDLKMKIAEDFPTLPNTSYSVKYVDESLEDYLSPAFYLTPPIDDMSKNVIYINPARNYKKAELYATLAHEGYPGHLYQTVYSNSFLSDKIRSIISFPGYIEGWATYSELYSYGLADMDKDLAEALRLNKSLTLGLYATVDIGIHYDGWDIEETALYLGTYGITGNETAKAIYRKIVEEPANYLKYYVGYLEFLELKEKAEYELENRFNALAFHEFLLKTGPAPFDILKKYIDVWISRQLSE